MKILFVNNSKVRGGGEEFLRDLLPGLAARGVKVGLIYRPGTPLAEIFKDSEITLHPIHRSGLRGLTAAFKTGQVIRKGGYEIIDIQRGHDVIQSWLGAKLSGKKPLLLYTPQIAEFLRSRFLLSRMTNIVTISRHIRDRIIDFFPEIASKITIIYYGIDLNKFRPDAVRRGAFRARFKLKSDTPIIGTVGDLWKNQIEFLDALVLIRKEIRDARFVLVAHESKTDGSVLAFKRRAAELGLTDSILWTERLSKEDMLSFYMDIDVAVNTHRNEGFGLWLVEALAVGLATISVPEGGIRDSLEGCPAGLLVDGGPREMAGQVIKVLKDRSLRTTMARSGPRWVAARFSRERMISDYYQFFCSLKCPMENRLPNGMVS